jgi:septum formation protein
MKKQLILASASPRREYLLEAFGVPFKIIPSHFDEESVSEKDPEELSLKLAAGKARLLATSERGLIIGADTLCVFENQILGKPNTKQEAKERLRSYQGKSHEVITGVCILDTEARKEKQILSVIKVWFKNFPEKASDKFLKEYYVLDKSAGYALYAAEESGLVQKFIGNYSTHLGLPLFDLAKVLEEFGLKVNRIDYEDYAKKYRESPSPHS